MNRSCLLVCLLFLAAPVVAQDEVPTKVTMSNRVGNLPYTTSIGTDVESVDVATGHLSVTIPFTSTPGRGMNSSFGMRFNSGFWYAATRVDINGQPYQRWNLEKRFYEPSDGFGWQTTVPSVSGVKTVYSCAPQGPAKTLYKGYIFQDSSGAKHPLAVQFGAACFDVIAESSNPALSAQGVWATLQSNSPTIYLADGTKLTGLGLSYDPIYKTGIRERQDFVDSNGNKKTHPYSTSGGLDTLGRAVVTRNTGTNQVLYRVYDSGGTQRTYTINYQSTTISTTFGATGGYGPILEASLSNRKRITSIVLPNGRSYSFQYDSWGNITRIDLPTGGYITYQWSTFGSNENAYRYISQRVVNVSATGPSATWTISITCPTWQGAECTGPVSTVTDPLGNQTVYTSNLLQELKSVKIYAGTQGGTPVRQYDIDYLDVDGSGNTIQGTRAPIRITTTLENGTTKSKVEYEYEHFTYPWTECDEDGNNCVTTTLTTSRGNVTEIREYDWGSGSPGALLRKTTKAYLHTGNSNYLSRNIVSKIIQEKVFNGAGTEFARTDIQYDNYGGANSLLTQSGAPQHDYTNYPASLLYRGNATHVTRWKSNAAALPAAVYRYDELGNIRKITDPVGHYTEWIYTDSWANSFCPPSSASFAYVSQVTNHLGHGIQLKRFPCTGLLQSRKDENDITANPPRNGTTFTYDLLNRLLTKADAGGGLVSNSYNDVAPVTLSTTTKIDPTLNHVLVTELDGLGRTRQTRLTSDPQGTVYTDFTYDAFGRKATESNPYHSGDSIWYTSYTYDVLGRTTQVVPTDGTLGNPCSNCIRTVYSLNTTEVFDQAGKKRRSTSDALGRLTKVEEPYPSSAYAYDTVYQYNPLGNLTRVDQKGGTTDALQWRTRTFSYDWLSQLTSAVNPESGTINYTYYDDGLLKIKDSPKPNQTGADRQYIKYCYDELHRLEKKYYYLLSEPDCDTTPSPNVLMSYDQTSFNGLAIDNEFGRRTGMVDASGQTAWTYDEVGRVTTERRTNNGVTRDTLYDYNENGSIYWLTHPSGRQLRYLYNGAAQPVSVQHMACGGNFLIQAQYAPHGALISAKLGFSADPDPCYSYPGTTLSNSYNKRLQPDLISATATGGTVISLNYKFQLGIANNGNVYEITDNVDLLSIPDRPVNSRTFTYDPLNRLATAQTTGTDCTQFASNNLTKNWGQSYSVDPWGNLLQINVTKCSTPTFAATDAAPNPIDNKLDQYSHDAAGNMTNIGGAITYDAENRISTAGGVTYTYDGDGRRVKKSNGTLYWYDLAGNVVEETNLTGTLLNTYAFFNRQRVVRWGATGDAVYYFSDHLGSASVLTDKVGARIEESHYYPFGGERAVLNSDPNAYKFTGKERDGESGLDHFGARHYGSGIARFASVDPNSAGVQLMNPQTWNAFSYAYNNPLRFVDPDGKKPLDFLNAVLAFRRFLDDMERAAATFQIEGAIYSAGAFALTVYGMKVTRGGVQSGKIVEMVAGGGLTAENLSQMKGYSEVLAKGVELQFQLQDQADAFIARLEAQLNLAQLSTMTTFELQQAQRELSALRLSAGAYLLSPAQTDRLNKIADALQAEIRRREEEERRKKEEEECKKKKRECTLR